MAQRAVIFDVDGVLVDSYRAHFEAWKRVAARVGRDLTEEEFASTFGRRNREIFHALWGNHVPEREIEPLGAWKEAEYRRILLADFPAMDGARDLIEALKAAGWRLAVGSSGPPENVSTALEGLRAAHLFDATVNGTEVRVGKPEPEVFLKAAGKLAIEPRFCAVIEDAPAGVEAAVRAGMTPIALEGTAPRERLLGAGAALVVDSLRDLSPRRIAALIDAQDKTATDFHR